MTAMPDAWTEVALVAIAKETDAKKDVQFATLTETVDISVGDKPMESIPTVSGGRVVKLSPQEDTEITLELYSSDLSVGDGSVTTALVSPGGLFQQFFGGSWDTAQPLEKKNMDDTNSIPHSRDKFRVSILWTNDVSATRANGATAASTDSLRFIARNCYMTSHKVAFTDDILKITATFKCPAATKSCGSNIAWQSGAQTALVALVDYTSSAWIA